LAEFKPTSEASGLALETPEMLKVQVGCRVEVQSSTEQQIVEVQCNPYFITTRVGLDVLIPDFLQAAISLSSRPML